MRMLRDVLFRPEMGRPRDWGELEALTALAFTEMPVLAIGAELDRAIPPEAARRIAITAPEGELLMLEGCGHFPFAEAPERYWPAVEAWLLRTAAGTSRVKRLSASSRSSTASPASASASTGAPSLHAGPSTRHLDALAGLERERPARAAAPAPPNATRSELASAAERPVLRTNAT